MLHGNRLQSPARAGSEPAKSHPKTPSWTLAPADDRPPVRTDVRLFAVNYDGYGGRIRERRLTRAGIDLDGPARAGQLSHWGGRAVLMPPALRAFGAPVVRYRAGCEGALELRRAGVAVPRRLR